MPKAKTSTSKVESKTFICNTCGKEMSVSKFYKSNREEYMQYNGVCTTCKTCLRKSTVDQNLNTVTKESIRDALKKVDKPLIDEVFQAIKNKNTTNSKFLGDYLSQLNLYPKYKNLVYADTIDIEIEQEKLMNSKVVEKNKETVTDVMKKFWGRGLENQDYLDLQDMFDNFTRNEDIMDFKKESDYKDLCIYQLQKSKMQFDFDSIPKVEKLQKMINDLSDNLGIQAIQKQDEFDNNKFVLGLITRYHEDIKKEPIRRWCEDLGHIDPFRDIITTDYIGGLGAAMGVNNPKVEEAKERMKEYMVKIEECYEEDGDLDG